MITVDPLSLARKIRANVLTQRKMRALLPILANGGGSQSPHIVAQLNALGLTLSPEELGIPSGAPAGYAAKRRTPHAIGMRITCLELELETLTGSLVRALGGQDESAT